MPCTFLPIEIPERRRVILKCVFGGGLCNVGSVGVGVLVLVVGGAEVGPEVTVGADEDVDVDAVVRRRVAARGAAPRRTARERAVVLMVAVRGAFVARSRREREMMFGLLCDPNTDLYPGRFHSGHEPQSKLT